MAEKRPNILLITTDQQRYDAVGINNPTTDLRTPTLDSLAARGVNFRRAYTTCPVCIPARRTLLSGLHPVTHGLRGYRDGLEWEAPISVPQRLSDAGYQTQLVGKLHLHPQRKRYGYQHMIRTESPNDRSDTPLQPVNDWVDWLKGQGVSHPNNIGINGNGRLARPWDMEERYHHSSYLADQAVDFVTRWRDPSCPYFLHLSFWAPHPPLIPPQAYWDRYNGRHGQKPTISNWTPQLPPAGRGINDDSATGPFDEQQMHEAIAGYFGLINHIDDRIRYVLTRMFEYGSPRAQEPTLILFTSDHGEMLGDHHLWRKSLPYEGSAHVPFIISWRNMDFTPGVCDQLVGLEDIAATVFESCGIDLPEQYDSDLQSRSLMPALRGQQCPTREALHGECLGMHHHFIVEGRLKYIWYSRTHEEQLFDVLSDPCEINDLSGDESLLVPLRRRLAAHIAAHGASRESADCQLDMARLTPCANRPPKAMWGDRAGW